MNINNINHELNKKIINKVFEELNSQIFENNKKGILAFKKEIEELVPDVDIDYECNKLVDSCVSKYNEITGYTSTFEQGKEILTEMISKTSKLYRDLPNGVSKDFQTLLSESLIKITEGTLTQEEVIETIMENYKGYTIIYSNGFKYAFDYYLEMLYTTSLKTILENHAKILANEIGTDVFEYSKKKPPAKSKSKSRDACIFLRGKLVAYHKSKPVEDLYGKKYKVYNLYDYGYGTPGGALGINCIDYMYPFVDGISVFLNSERDIIKETLNE